MTIITKKTKNYNKSFENLNTLLKITIIGDGSEIFDYSLPTPNNYKRYSEELYTLEYALKGVFWTKKGNDFLNDILLRFNISMNVRNIETRTIGNKKNLHELKSFSSSSSLETLRKKIFVSKSTGTKEGAVFWGIKLFLEYQISQGCDFVPYSTVENYAFNHYVDNVKDNSTLRAKCRNIWHYYEDRGFVSDQKYIKKDKGEVMATRLEHVEKLAKEKRELNTHKILSAIDYLKSKNEKLTARNISKVSKIHVNTLTRYKHLWKK